MDIRESGTFDILAEARRVLEEESSAVAALAARIDADMAGAVEAVFGCDGRVIVTGMGKSGLVGRKIASTLASTGTPAMFLHPAEGLHGDLGVITDRDIAIAISTSGETAELLAILPFFKRFGVRIIALCGKRESTLGRAADWYLDVAVEREACPLGITPTSSSTATLAMGDALAMALLRRRNFRSEDFALRHPGGSLGRQLLLHVSDLWHHGEAVPCVADTVNLRAAILEMSRKRLGLTAIVDAEGKLIGILTDGDLRRILERGGNHLDEPVAGFMSRNPKTIAADALAMEALRLMEQHAITALIVPDASGKPAGVIHIHDILRAGLR